MAREQFGICAEPNLHGYYIMFNAMDNKNAYLRKALSRFPAMIDDYADQFSESNLTGVVAVGANFWQELYPAATPKLLKPFPMMSCEDRIAPSVSYDLYVEIRSDRADVNHIVAMKICELLGDSVEIIEQVKGFRFLDGRDLTGFVDGTENPQGRHRREVALVNKADDETFASGSYLHVQRYKHNLSLWQSVPEKQQEDVFGRTKRNNEEYSEKAATAHTKRTSLKDAQGNNIEILRQSMPYGHLKVQGLMFVSYCHTPEHFALILKSMIYGDGQGNYDHMLKYTQAETGAAFFAPSINFLESQGVEHFEEVF